MTHIADDMLIDIAMGEPTPADAKSHLRECGFCREALDSYALTTVTLRHAGTTVLTPPPATVWAAIESDIAAQDTTAGTNPAADPAETRLPAVSDAQPGPTPKARRGINAWWLAAAVAIGLTLGAVGNAVLGTPDKSPAPATVAVARLDTLDTNKELGTADLARTATAMDLRVSTQRLQAGSGYLEVWLINRDLKRMVSVGVLPSEATSASFPVAASLIDQGYVIVDISREAFDDKPAHSGDSVVRGELVI